MLHGEVSGALEALDAGVDHLPGHPRKRLLDVQSRTAPCCPWDLQCERERLREGPRRMKGKRETWRSSAGGVAGSEAGLLGGGAGGAHKP